MAKIDVLKTKNERGLSMSTLVDVKVLDEASWQAWVAKGRTKDDRSNAALVRVAKCIAAVALIAAAAFWSYVTPYDIGIRFIASMGAVVVMFQALYAGQYAFAVIFAALMLLYNPVVPVFAFSGEWQRVVVVLSAVPFLASLAWAKARLVHHV
ncbi:MAG TPA: DUF6804 family protein [Bryobacteraceae bacterium]|nr:DUF6804 family protein [Bryobacteraceae bacterium]